MFSYSVYASGTRKGLFPTGKWRLYKYSDGDTQLYIQCKVITNYRDVYKPFLKIFKKTVGVDPVYSLRWYHESQITIVEEPEILEFDCKGE